MDQNPFDQDDRKYSTSAFDSANDSSGRPILWLALGLLAVCCGLGAAGAFFYFKPDPQALIGQYFPSPTLTPTSTPTRTPTPTMTPSPTFTPTPNLTATQQALDVTSTVQAIEATATNAAGQWRVVLTDTFDSNKNKWLNESADDEFAKVDYKVADGKYRWEATAHQSYIGWVRANAKALGDFYVSVEVKQVSGPDTADYGLVFRENDEGQFYYFGINDNGQYLLYEYYGDWVTLISPTKTDLIRPGEANRIGILAQGPQFTFFVNDQYVASITDEHIANGLVALAVEMSQENDQAVFEFDHFELRKP